LLDQHDQIQLEQIQRFNGRLVNSAGDGILSTFKRPDNALRCAKALILALAELGLQLKAGIHFGDIEQREHGRVSGVTVHIGARIAAFAGPSEVVVSRTVRDILLGSPFHFQELGLHELRGIHETWMLYRAH
jgi:class 3 adenylate cyclase